MVVRKWQRIVVLALFMLLGSASGPWAAMARQEVPAPLREWIPWVLHGQEQATCAFDAIDGNPVCAWPSRLELRLTDRGGSFSQEWQLQVAGWLELPGGSGAWPEEVRVDGRQTPVLDHDGIPAIWMQAGYRRLTGSFTWSKRPESLPVPPQTGLVALTLNGRAITFPRRDESGRLWLSGGREEAAAEMDRLELRVFRHILDAIPLELTTRIELDVSGAPRETVLGWTLPGDYIPLSLTGDLPVRLENDGRLRVQLRPGQWAITLKARTLGPANKIELQKVGDNWPEQEIWVFAAQNQLRLVNVEGGVIVDPSQTGLPGAWQALPAYKLTGGEALTLVEKKRGDPEPAPDNLRLTRNLWLDEDGNGATIRDQIEGTISSGWRLELAPPGKLGRVSIDGRDQLITRVGDTDRDGIELRRGSLSLVAESRLEQGLGAMPAVGWHHDFNQVETILHLPPGWRLLAATGVDRAPTWLSGWSLLDLFLVLIIFLATLKLYGPAWGGLALSTLALTFHEPDSPRWIWLNLLAAVALLGVLPKEQAPARWLARYRLLLLAVLVLLVIPFMVKQVRVGIYPQLERVAGYPLPEVAAPPAPPVASAPMEYYEEKAAAPEPELAEEMAVPLEKQVRRQRAIKQKILSSSLESDMVQSNQQATLLDYDVKARIQTGPGLPQWQWKQVAMRWNGPVTASQQVDLYLLPPWLNLILAFVRVALLAGLAFCFLRRPGISFGASRRALAGMALFALLAGLAAVPAPCRAELPDQQLLNELRQRLLEKPECYPACGEIPLLRLDVSQDQLTVGLDLEVGAEIGVPLPGRVGEWEPEQVLLDGAPARALARDTDGVLLLLVQPGVHRVVLRGKLPPRPTVQLALPLAPRRVEVKQQHGWAVEGVHEDGQVDISLQLRRLQQGQAAAATLETGELPPFVRVERTLHLGLEWQVETRVSRLSPPGSPIILALPLLPGESVLSGHLRVEQNMAQINMAPQEQQVTWQSAFAREEQFALTAQESTSWIEVWRLDASPVWHVTTTGIPIIHHQDSSGYWQPEWHPWPGETLNFEVSRPAGVEGATVTIDESRLELRPGQRSSEAVLSVTLRSSRGGQHTLELPEGAQLQQVRVNGASQPIRQSGRQITLPLVPGRQEAQLTWRRDEEMGLLHITPRVDLGAESVNSRISLKPGRDRWILMAGGPRMGPAVLFWGELLIIVLAALGLGRLTITPLRWHQWLLLGIGLSQVHVVISGLVVGWLLALGARARRGGEIKKAGVFDLMQAGLALLSVVALLLLFHAIEQGLLGHPAMQISGNLSSAYELNWYQPRSSSLLPTAWLLSVPILVYRLLMLAWALWLAMALIGWLRWGWQCVSDGGLWRPLNWKRARATARAKQASGAPPEQR